MEVPDPSWLQNYQYFHYDGRWFKGSADGTEVEYHEQEPTDSADMHTYQQGDGEDISSGENEPDNDAVPVPEKGSGGLDLYEVRKDKANLETYQ